MTYLPPGFRSARCGTFVAEAVEVGQRPRHLGLAGDRHQVQHGVGRAAQGQHERVGVLQRLAGDDVARPDVLLDQLHQRLAGQERLALLGGATPPGSWRRRAATCPSPRWRWTMVLAVYMPPHEPAPGQASHSTLWTPFVVELAGLVLADRLEDGDDVDVLAVGADAGQDAAAVDEDARDVEPGHGHDAAGHVLVAAAEGEQAVVVHAAGRRLRCCRR